MVQAEIKGKTLLIPVVHVFQDGNITSLITDVEHRREAVGDPWMAFAALLVVDIAYNAAGPSGRTVHSLTVNCLVAGFGQENIPRRCWTR